MPQNSDSSDGNQPLFVAPQTETPPPESADMLFSCLADQRRRMLLNYLSEHRKPCSINELARELSSRTTETAADEVKYDRINEMEISLFHLHVPKLEDAGVVEMDLDRKIVQPGDRFDAVLSLSDTVGQ